MILDFFKSLLLAIVLLLVVCTGVYFFVVEDIKTATRDVVPLIGNTDTTHLSVTPIR